MNTTSATAPPPTQTLLDRLAKSGLVHTRFLNLLLIPHKVDESIATRLKSHEDVAPMIPERIRLNPTPRVPAGPLVEIWRPTGAWRWTRGMSIKRCNNVIKLTDDPKSTCKSYYGTGTIGSQELEFLCRSWPRGLEGFRNELTLYKSQLAPLRGTYVPNVIGVYSGVDDTINMLMELPHAQFWLEASDDMPDVLKKRCIDCFEKVHAAGVLHGAPYLYNIFIGGDARVTVANFEHAAVLEPIPDVAQKSVTADKLRLEMRQVKYLLNYDNARQQEQQRWLRYKSRLEWNERERQLTRTDPKHEPQYLAEPDDELRDPPVNFVKEKGWRTDRHKARRYVNPTISNEAFTTAVEKFIANVRRMEREGDGPPKSRPPSPAPPAIQHLPSPPSESADLSDEPERSPPPRRSTRKRKAREEDGESPTPKRQRKTPTPTDIKPIPPTKPIRLESFIAGCSKDSEMETGTLVDSAAPGVMRARDFAFEVTGPPVPPATDLRSAIRSVPATFVTPPPEIERPPIAPRSATARGKRKRRNDEEDGVVVKAEESPDSPLPKAKRPRTDADGQDTSPASKRVSFAPAPEVHLKKWDIPPEMLTPAKFKYHHGPSGFRRKRSRQSSPPASSSGGLFKFTPPLAFRFVTRWVTDVIHRVQS